MPAAKAFSSKAFAFIIGYYFTQPGASITGIYYFEQKSWAFSIIIIPVVVQFVIAKLSSSASCNSGGFSSSVSSGRSPSDSRADGHSGGAG
jgi:hypothetical protein